MDETNRLVLFFTESKLISKSGLARMMYPNVKHPYRKLQAKLKEKGRSFNDHDYKRLELIAIKLLTDLDYELSIHKRTSKLAKPLAY